MLCVIKNVWEDPRDPNAGIEGIDEVLNARGLATPNSTPRNPRPSHLGTYIPDTTLRDNVFQPLHGATC